MINNNIINQNKNNPIEDFNYYKGKIPAVRYDEGSYLRKRPESFPEVLERLGLLGSKIRITSGHRKPGEAGNAGARSNHTKLNKFGQPYAYDIVPVGMSFTDLDNLIRDNVELQQYLMDNNYRIIREDTADAIAKYGSTGRHWHLSYRPGSTEGTSFRDYVSEYYGNKEDLQNIDAVNDLEDIEIPQLGLGTKELQHTSMTDNTEQDSSNEDYPNGRPTVILAPVEDTQISSTKKVPQEKFMDRYMKILTGVDQYINKYIPEYVQENSIDSQVSTHNNKVYSNLFYSGGNTQEDQDLQRRLRAEEEAKYYNFSKKAIEDIQSGKGATVTTPEIVVIGKDLSKTKVNVPAPKPILIPVLPQESEDSFIPQVLQEQPKINVGQITTEDLNQKYSKYYEYPILDNVHQDMPSIYSTVSVGKESLVKDAIAKLTEGLQFDNNVNLINYIDTVPDDAIFEAISSSSNYGKQYIENIKKQNRLTSSTADKLRDYLKESSSMLPINNSINEQTYDVHNTFIPSSNSVKPNLFYGGGDTMTSQFLDQVLADREANQLRNEELASQYNFSPQAISDIQQGKDVNVYTPDVVVTGKAPSVGFYPYGYRTVDKFYQDNPSGLMEDAGSFVPFVGDGMEIGNIGENLYKGNYNQAVVGLGLMALPNVLEKPMKYVGRKLHNLYNTFQNVKTTPQITLENAASITPEQWTAAQDAAIARGDMAEAQRLRDLHFDVESGVKHKLVYRGDRYNNPRAGTEYVYFTESQKEPYIFHHSDLTPKPLKYLREDRGIYFTDSRPYAELYSSSPKNLGDYYLRIKKPYNMEEPINFEAVMKKYKEPEFHVNYDGIIGKDAPYYTSPWYAKVQTEWEGNKGTTHVIRTSNNAKLADAVTYDDNGIRIPLGKRDNFNRNDIRYGFIPPVAAGLGLSLYNYDNQRQHSLGGHLNKFEEGGNIDDSEYQTFLNDVKKHAPDLAAPSRNYNMRRYWELRGKPSNWAEAQRDFNYLYNVKEDPMFTLENDGFYHAKSVALNQNTGIIEFMKSADHPTVKYELNWYDNGDETGPNGLRIPSFEGFKSSQNFKKNYELKYYPKENKYYYIPKQR